MKATLWALLLLLSASSPLFAMKNRFQDFPEPCDVVWKATVAVAKTQDYRLISISDEEKMISLAAGGFLSGERIISLTVAPAPEHGCRVTVQSRFSGLAHSDGPDLLGRIRVQAVGDELGRETAAFRHFKRCVDHSSTKSPQECEEIFRKKLAAQKANASQPDAAAAWYNVTKPTGPQK